ncbi:mannose-1-phosphate guanylyltransferase/mannose-6-phosphate isomerase [Shimia sp. MIT910701]|uniref:mannose-1-phosphate guanylyltransferase/mannose-6-phosphate isomerase n=1 Tax=Shimia sp. MIT910701 TaxID=3096987 RepID=UPI003999DDDE
MIYPILLCGGSGTRLWPLSRQSYPKQFSPLFAEESLFQMAAKRLSGPEFSAPVVATGDPFRFIVTEQLAQVGKAANAVLIEPSPRDTAPAVLAAALWCSRKDPDALLLVAPSDHLIRDEERFRETISAATPAAEGGSLVTFGIKPTRSETGYGYLELAESADASEGVPQDLARFVEKPNLDDARRMVADGHHLWNAGIFLFSAKTILDAYRAHAPDMLKAVSKSLSDATLDLGYTKLAAEPWTEAEKISIDYAIMEKSANLKVMPYDGDWSDLGDWDALKRSAESDTKNNVLTERTTARNCTDTMLWNHSEGIELVGLGLDNIIAVATDDAVLVAHKSRAQEVREIVGNLRDRNISQADQHRKDYRPWGWFETLVKGDRFQVKRIRVHPGGVLSLQSHLHRSEHWVVVQGTAQVTIGETVQLVHENQSVYVPVGERHRLENPGKVPITLIEVQTGAYLGEDDIVRYDDLYARS